MADAPRDPDDELLASIGLSVDDPAVRAEATRIARRLRASGARAIGFVPADDVVAVPPIAIQLGLALCDLTGATIAVVDANVRYPGLSGLADDDGETDESVFATRWLRGSLALLTPPRVERAGEVVPRLARLLLESADLFAHILVDLTGFDLIGDHASAAACMDGVVVVGRAHVTREYHLQDLRRLLPENRFLGVLLSG
ncbi:MAG: hypothetical protein K8W52_18310 [Deltaproteobacteria bacterium]|nr:hypothetical protein [Deltaproteobacteria bacterium]